MLLPRSNSFHCYQQARGLYGLGRGSGEVEGGQKWCQRILEELPSVL